MTTYYLRRDSDGEIVNACEFSGPLAQLNPQHGHYYDPNPPLTVLQRYRYWDERP